MRVSSYAVARPAAFDRNPVQTVKSYASFSLAPAALTSRWSYTVPAGKRAVMTSGNIFVQRNTVATSVGQNQYEIYVAPVGVGATAFMQFYDSDNTLNRSLTLVISQGPLLNATDVVAAQTRDTSTGGSNNVSISATFTEFDA